MFHVFSNWLYRREFDKNVCRALRGNNIKNFCHTENWIKSCKENRPRYIGLEPKNMDYNQIETNLRFKLMSSHWHNKGNSILASAIFINLVYEYHHTFIRDNPNIIISSLNFTPGNSTLIIRISSFRINTSISSNTKRHESAIFLFKDQQNFSAKPWAGS